MLKSSNGAKKGKRKNSRLSLVDSQNSSPTKTSSRPPKVTGLIRKDAALRRLEITPAELAQVPEITSILKSSFKNTKAAIQSIRFSNETAAIEFLKVYDELPVGDREYISIEAICLKAAVSPAALLGATFLACKTIRGQESALIAVNAHPQILKDTIQFASLPGGDRDRKMLHEAVGFLPTPKGGSINVNLLGGVPQFKNPEHHIEPDEENFEELFPSISRSLEDWSNDRKRLLADNT